MVKLYNSFRSFKATLSREAAKGGSTFASARRGAPLRDNKRIPFKISSEGDSLWAHLESNQAPTDYESVALTE